MLVRVCVLHRGFVQHYLVLLMMRVNDPEVVVDMTLLIHTSEQVKALSEDLALHLLLLGESPFHDIHSTLLPYSLAHVGVHIVLIIKDCIHSMHLAESYYV